VRRVATAVVAAAVAAAVVDARQATQTPSFDIVSVKKNVSGDRMSGLQILPGGRYAWTNTTLENLIGTAYQRGGFDSSEIIGGPAWLDKDRFDVVAHATAVPPSDPDGFPSALFEMIRAVLADRFKLQLHDEMRERPVYALVLARTDGRLGPRLTKSTTDCAAVLRDEVAGKKVELTTRGVRPCAVGGPQGRMQAAGLTIDQLANVLRRVVNRPVINRTGLSGAFDWDLEYNPEFVLPLPCEPAPVGTPANERPTVFTAVQEQLGLRLESTRVPVRVLVVDRAEQPTPD
jgi:uncharacterized protein (TIGR03435 family)